MTFDVAAQAYDQFMGRFSEPLAIGFADFTGVRAGQRALDVGCGPGALTARLVERLGADGVSAVDPSTSFVAALAERLPEVDVHAGAAEDLPFGDSVFDVVACQLVVHFMADPLAGLREMRRVCRPGGTVAACVWRRSGLGVGPLTTFWQAVGDLNPSATGEDARPGTGEGELARLMVEAGLRDTVATLLTVSVRFETFAQWWEPYTFGVGPAGEYVKALDDAGCEAVRARCEDLLPPAPFEVSGSAWAVRAHA
ncbi:class I SAM-dependent methyltransferase [Angustibacter sp. McL0619]|uniref:class I SAM-dependent methyltransferase n=1 Tax=Angustibacter sp. McL0619 TaxID=3415676 RepID=UPI003CEB6901